MSQGKHEPGVPWRHFASVYDRLASPLRPAPSDVERMRAAIAPHDDQTLLLGVTPGIASLGQNLIAVEGSRAMIDRLWPGDQPDRRALVGDWTALPFEAGQFGSVIGDGALNSVASGLESLIDEIARVLREGGIAAQRIFASPDDREPLEAVRSDALSGRAGNVHALKWRIAMAIAHPPDYLVAVADILDAFNAMFPDRAELASVTGWDRSAIDTLDAYVGAWHSLSFPTLRALQDMSASRFATFRLVESGGYPLAERCPLIVWTR
ncbi:MAG: methyltransferase domain-containing protein [Sphingomicrobium sp.]